MALIVKICGLNDPESVQVAVEEGADMVGFNFYPPSPRAVSPAQAGALSHFVREGVLKVGIFVDPSDDLLAETVRQGRLDIIQLHGTETPERLAAIKSRFGKAVMKVFKLASADDLAQVDPFLALADRLMFDTKAPASMKDALPGGNAIAFDWTILSGRTWARPWMLAGALNPDNLKEAVSITGAPGVDVSSGVESRPGHKDPDKIRAFMRAARQL